MRLTPEQLETIFSQTESGDGNPSDLEDSVFLLISHIEAQDVELTEAKMFADIARTRESEQQQRAALLQLKVNELLEERPKIWDAAIDTVAALSDPAYTIEINENTELITLNDVWQARQENPFT